MTCLLNYPFCHKHLTNTSGCHQLLFFIVLAFSLLVCINMWPYNILVINETNNVTPKTISFCHFLHILGRKGEGGSGSEEENGMGTKIPMLNGWDEGESGVFRPTANWCIVSLYRLMLRFLHGRRAREPIAVAINNQSNGEKILLTWTAWLAARLVRFHKGKDKIQETHISLCIQMVSPGLLTMYV